MPSLSLNSHSLKFNFLEKRNVFQFSVQPSSGGEHTSTAEDIQEKQKQKQKSQEQAKVTNQIHDQTSHLRAEVQRGRNKLAENGISSLQYIVDASGIKNTFYVKNGEIYQHFWENNDTNNGSQVVDNNSNASFSNDKIISNHAFQHNNGNYYNLKVDETNGIKLELSQNQNPLVVAVPSPEISISQVEIVDTQEPFFVDNTSYIPNNSTFSNTVDYSESGYSDELNNYAEALPLSRKEAINNLQIFLKGLDLYKGKLDGIKGGGTNKAIQEVRNQYDTDTISQLDEYISSINNSGSKIVTQKKHIPVASKIQKASHENKETVQQNEQQKQKIIKLQILLKNKGYKGTDGELLIDGVEGGETRYALASIKKQIQISDTNNVTGWEGISIERVIQFLKKNPQKT